MADVQVLLDKEAIREAVMRYCRGADRCDAALVASAYHPDARDERPGQELSGPSIGEEVVKSLLATMRSTNHQSGEGVVP